MGRNSGGGWLYDSISDWVEIAGDGEWTQISFATDEIQEGTAYAEILMGNANTEDSAGEYYIDDVVVCEKTASVPAESVTLNQTEAIIKVGEGLALTAAIAPENVCNDLVVWTSSNENVAKVDNNGNVTAMAAGTADITVTALSGEKTATCKVTVRPTDAQLADMAKALIEETLEKLSVSNNTTEADVTRAIEEALAQGDFEGVTFVVEDYRVIPSTEEIEGSITATIQVICGDAAAAVNMAMTIEKLEPTKPEIYELTVVGGSGSGAYEEGQEVTVTAEQKEGKEFLYWRVEGITLAVDTASTVTITMPAHPVKLTAVYMDITDPVNPGDGDTDDGGQGGSTGNSSAGEKNKDGNGISNENQNNNAGKEEPKTGDDTPLWLWMAVLFVCGGTLIGVTVYRRIRKE